MNNKNIKAETIKVEKTTQAFLLTTEQLEDIVYKAVVKATEKKEEPVDPLELMNLKQIMAVFGKSRSTIFSWKKQRILSPVYVSGSLYFRKADIIKIINQNKK